MKKIVFLFFIIPFLAIAQKKSEPNKKGTSKNKMDNEYTPKDIKVYGKSEGSSNNVEMDKNLIFFDIGTLIRSTVLIGYEREITKKLNANIQFGAANKDFVTLLYYDALDITNEKYAAVKSLLEQNSDGLNSSFGLAFASELKLFVSENSDKRTFLKFGYRHASSNATDNRKWDYRYPNTNVTINLAEPVNFKIRNNFLYFGLGSNRQNDAGLFTEFSFSIGFKFTTYDANFETRQSFADRNRLQDINRFGDGPQSVFTGGQFGEPLKTSNFIFLFSYRIGLGF